MKFWRCCFAFFTVLIIWLNAAGINQAWANDPFDKTQRDASPQDFSEHHETSLETQAPIELCARDEHRQAADVSIQAMKLVGVVIGKEHAFALLVDNTAQLYLVPEGAEIAQEGYWLEKVNKNHVQLMKKSGEACNQTETKQLNF